PHDVCSRAGLAAQCRCVSASNDLLGSIAVTMVSHTPGNASEAWDCSERLEGIHRAHLLPNATQDHSVPP
ncbi:MAG: hypothetical protein ACK47D_20835, partial [Pseudanabaena sp.]